MKWVATAIVLASVITPGVSHAQSLIIPENMDLNLSFTVGAAMAVNSNIQNDTYPMLGLAWYEATGDMFGSNSCIGLSIDWLPIQREDGLDVDLVPMFFNLKAYGADAGYRLFATLGIGILVASDGIPQMLLEDGANFGWTAGFGLDITNEFFAQFRFIGSKNPSDDGLMSIQLGYRF